MNISDLYIGKRFEFGGIEWEITDLCRDYFSGQTINEESFFEKSKIDLNSKFIDEARWH